MLRWVYSQLDVATDDIWAFGDGNNDTAMLQATGWSCACANAEWQAQSELASAVLADSNNGLNFTAAELDVAMGFTDTTTYGTQTCAAPARCGGGLTCARRGEG